MDRMSYNIRIMRPVHVLFCYLILKYDKEPMIAVPCIYPSDIGKWEMNSLYNGQRLDNELTSA